MNGENMSGESMSGMGVKSCDTKSFDAKTLDEAKNLIRAQMKAVRKNIPEATRQAHSQKVCELLMQMPEFIAAKTVAAYKAFGSELCFDYLAKNFPQDKRLVVPCTLANHKMEYIEVEPQEILPSASRTSNSNLASTLALNLAQDSTSALNSTQDLTASASSETSVGATSSAPATPASAISASTTMSELTFLKDPGKIGTLPKGRHVVSQNQIDIMFVPGLAFDDAGYRLGYGGGYYDTYLKRDGFKATVVGTFFAEQHYCGSLPHSASGKDCDVSLPFIATQDGIRQIG